MEYKIIEADKTFELEEQVNQLLTLGWQLAGGVAFVKGIPGQRVEFCCQAMYRES